MEEGVPRENERNTPKMAEFKKKKGLNQPNRNISRTAYNMKVFMGLP